MILLVGTKNSNIKNGIINQERCSKCDTENTLHFSIFRKYVYLTLIPLFPVGKLVFINCSNCGKNFDYEDLNQNALLKLANEKVKTSFWMFTGSFTLIVFLIYTLNNYLAKNDETQNLIKNPIEGDVYNLKFSNGYYSNMKIDKVTKDSIYVTHNDFNAYMFYETDDLDKPENYSNRKAYYSRKDILKLYQENEITEIKRKTKELIIKN